MANIDSSFSKTLSTDLVAENPDKLQELLGDELAEHEAEVQSLKNLSPEEHRRIYQQSLNRHGDPNAEQRPADSRRAQIRLRVRLAHPEWKVDGALMNAEVARLLKA